MMHGLFAYWPAAGWNFLGFCVVRSGICECRTDFRNDLCPQLACAKPFCETPIPKNFWLRQPTYSLFKWFHNVILPATTPSGNVFFGRTPNEEIFLAFCVYEAVIYWYSCSQGFKWAKPLHRSKRCQNPQGQVGAAAGRVENPHTAPSGVKISSRASAHIATEVTGSAQPIGLLGIQFEFVFSRFGFFLIFF